MRRSLCGTFLMWDIQCETQRQNGTFQTTVYILLFPARLDAATIKARDVIAFVGSILNSKSSRWYTMRESRQREALCERMKQMKCTSRDRDEAENKNAGYYSWNSCPFASVIIVQPLWKVRCIRGGSNVSVKGRGSCTVLSKFVVFISPSRTHYFKHPHSVRFASTRGTLHLNRNGMYLINENTGRGNRNLNSARFNEKAYRFRQRILFKAAADSGRNPLRRFT